MSSSPSNDQKIEGAPDSSTNVNLNPGDKVDPRNRRCKNWWEPMFDKNSKEKFTVSDWNFDNNMGPRRYLFLADTIKGESTHVIKDVSFYECDFNGIFERKIVFKNCKFFKCDFGLSTFKRTKFTDCEFTSSSFSQCILENCELRHCKYEKTSFAGNETQIPRTLIAEPHEFIFGACATVDHLPEGKSAFEQKARFEETRSTVARAILANLHSEGSEETYYVAVRVAAISEDRAKIARSLLTVRSAFKNADNRGFLLGIFVFLSGMLRALSAVAGMAILYLMGTLNAWGSSISRALIIGTIAISVIAFLYKFFFKLPYGDAVIKSLEVFFLFGYTNYAKMGSDDFYLVFTNAVLGLFWYAIAIPTISNRLTRARG